MSAARGDVTWTTGRKGADGAQLTAGLSSLSRVARAAVNLSFSFRTPSPHDSLALKTTGRQNGINWKRDESHAPGATRLEAQQVADR